MWEATNKRHYKYTHENDGPNGSHGQFLPAAPRTEISYGQLIADLTMTCIVIGPHPFQAPRGGVLTKNWGYTASSEEGEVDDHQHE